MERRKDRKAEEHSVALVPAGRVRMLTSHVPALTKRLQKRYSAFIKEV